MSQKRGGETEDDAPRCDCDALADLKECKNGKPENVGKEFWTCRFRKCKFFQWKGQAAGAKRKWPAKDSKGYFRSGARESPLRRDGDDAQSAPPSKKRASEESLPDDPMAVTLMENIIKAASKSMAVAEKLEGLVEVITKAMGGPRDSNGSPLVPSTPVSTPADEEEDGQTSRDPKPPKSSAPAPPPRKPQ